MVVDLPAPLGPRSPTHLPHGTSRSRPSTAAIVPNRFFIPLIRMAARALSWPVAVAMNSDYSGLVRLRSEDSSTAGDVGEAHEEPPHLCPTAPLAYSS